MLHIVADANSPSWLRVEVHLFELIMKLSSHLEKECEHDSTCRRPPHTGSHT